MICWFVFTIKMRSGGVLGFASVQICPISVVRMSNRALRARSKVSCSCQDAPQAPPRRLESTPKVLRRSPRCPQAPLANPKPPSKIPTCFKKYGFYNEI